jgi:hypothetical protein
LKKKETYVLFSGVDVACHSFDLVYSLMPGCRPVESVYRPIVFDDLEFTPGGPNSKPKPDVG